MICSYFLRCPWNTRISHELPRFANNRKKKTEKVSRISDSGVKVHYIDWICFLYSSQSTMMKTERICFLTSLHYFSIVESDVNFDSYWNLNMYDLRFRCSRIFISNSRCDRWHCSFRHSRCYPYHNLHSIVCDSEEVGGPGEILLTDWNVLKVLFYFHSLYFMYIIMLQIYLHIMK